MLCDVGSGWVFNHYSIMGIIGVLVTVLYYSKAPQKKNDIFENYVDMQTSYEGT